MRVITGSARGRKLFGPKSDRIRPAIDKVKQAVFNILGDVGGLTVLDLFAGTGSMGIEALSRGATQATFVDRLPEAIQLIKKNLEMCRFLDRSEIVKVGVQNFEPLHPYDLIFVDPPYDKNLVNPTLQWLDSERVLVGTDLLRPTKRSERSNKELPDGGFGGREGSPPECLEKLLAPTGIIVVEHSPREGVEGRSGLELFDQRKYGQTLISFLKGR